MSEEKSSSDVTSSFFDESEADTSFLSIVLNFISTNGWFITFGLIGLYMLYRKLGSYLPTMRSRVSPPAPQNYGPSDADEFVRRQEALERARRKMQEVQDALAEKQKEKMAQLEEQKRQEKINNWEQFQKGRGLGSKLRTTSTNESSAECSGLSRRPKSSQDSSDRLRGSDYNPLMGTSGGSSYRPERRCVSQGGG
ncbi:selenoprotein S-like [Dermacentor albipictus]|uniref:selenoprotein S-like n=1 Tax=Dermacentor albipictus TaxID=60249 RepID=UPI0031FBFF34